MDFDKNAESASAQVVALEPLTSPKTGAEVLRHIDSLADSLNVREPTGNAVAFERSTPKKSNDALAGGVLAIPPRIFREYADEFKEMALAASDEQLRALYLKLQNMWKDAATQFETGLADEVRRESRPSNRRTRAAESVVRPDGAGSEDG